MGRSQKKEKKKKQQCFQIHISINYFSLWAVVEVGLPQRSSSSSCSQQNEVRRWGPSSLCENLVGLFKTNPIAQTSAA